MINKIRLPLFILAGVGFMICERYLAFESYHFYLLATILAVATACTIIPLANAFYSQRHSPEEKQSWFLVFGWQFAVLLSAVGFLVYQKSLGSAAGPETLAAKALLGLWSLFFILGTASGIGIELAHANAGTGSLAEPKRVRRSAVSWLMVGMVFASLVCINYVGAKRDKVSDWSYLKTTTPSESTEKILKSSPDPIEVAIFFPQGNEVRPFVSEYFDYLKAKNGNLKLNYFDKDLQPTQAEEYKVAKNGQIVFRLKDKRERLDIGLQLNSARHTLRKLDGEVQKLILRLVQDKKKLYFTRGHGEFAWNNNEKDPLRSIELLETFVRGQNYSVSTLTLAEGGGAQIPDDASAVVIVGADAPFLKQEIDAISAYLEKGGRLLVMLDPMPSVKDSPSVAGATADPLVEFLAKAGLRFQKKLLANDKNYLNASNSLADRWFLFSNSFSSHDSVATLSKNDERAAVLFYQAGSFEVDAKAVEWRATTTIRSITDTFADENKNYKYDANEKRQTYSLGVAANKPVKTVDKDGKAIETDARIIAIADANVISDALIRNRANAIYFIDSLKWLVGQSDLAGEISTEEDVKIVHTQKEDAVWFTATVVVVPIFLLIFGFIATRKKKFKG